MGGDAGEAEHPGAGRIHGRLHPLAGPALGDIEHTFTRPYRPATNGKVERFNRTLTTEWAYARPWTSDGQRTRALARWLHTYNHHRHHTAIGGPPISRVGNVPGFYS